MKKLGVIILNWNGLELLKQFIPAAVEHTISPETDLIVADNGSTDASLQWLQANYPQVRIVAMERNYGFAEGYNRAIEECDYPYTVLLNSDVEVTARWWQPLLAVLESNPGIGAVQPKIRSWRDKKKFEYAGAAGGYLDRLGYPYCRGRIFEAIESDDGQYDSPEPVDICWASGACLAVNTDVYRLTGGLDPLFFAHMEEIDLCCRMHAKGYRVCAVSSSHVYHVGGASLAQGNPQKTYLNFRNNLLLLHKNLPETTGRRRLLLRRLADTLAWGMYVVKGDWKNARAILKAHTDFRKMKKHYTHFPKRDALAGLPGADRYIVWEHYALRRNK